MLLSSGIIDAPFEIKVMAIMQSAMRHLQNLFEEKGNDVFSNEVRVNPLLSVGSAQVEVYRLFTE